MKRFASSSLGCAWQAVKYKVIAHNKISEVTFLYNLHTPFLLDYAGKIMVP